MIDKSGDNFKIYPINAGRGIISMIKKIGLSLVVGMLYCSSALAIPNSEQYLKCMEKESSDAGTAKCYEDEIKYFEKMTKENMKEMKKWDRYEHLVKSKEYNIDDQYKAFQEFLDSFCAYYVRAKQGQGYSDRYLEADCKIGYVQMYAGYLSGVITKGAHSCGEH